MQIATGEVTARGTAELFCPQLPSSWAFPLLSLLSAIPFLIVPWTSNLYVLLLSNLLTNGLPLSFSCFLQSLCCWWSHCFCCFCPSGQGTRYSCLLSLITQRGDYICNTWSTCLSFSRSFLLPKVGEMFARVNLKEGLIQVDCLTSVCCRVSKSGRYCYVLSSCLL